MEKFSFWLQVNLKTIKDFSNIRPHFGIQSEKHKTGRELTSDFEMLN